MPLSNDYFGRLAFIGAEGPRETEYQTMRTQRAKVRADFLQQLRDQQARMVNFAATIPPQDYQRPGQPGAYGQYGLPSGFSGLSMYPLKGSLRVTSPYGVSRKGHKGPHTGIDWAAPAGTTIYAPAAGVVRFAGWNKIYGNQTIIDLGGGRSIMLGHQSGYMVHPGQRITPGMAIGSVGSTGWSTGPHLHFETWVNNRPVNPLSWFV